MRSSQEFVDLNRKQAHSETDDFTLDRYLSFLERLRTGTVDVLDVGCNTGRGGAMMKAKEPRLRIVGLDCVPERLSGLDQTVYTQSICGFTHELPLRSYTFDAIVAGEVIEHIPPQFVFSSLCEFFRLLRLKGRLLLTTPNPRYAKNRILGQSVLLDPSHVSQHTQSSLSRRLEEAGFSNIKTFGSGRVSKILGPYFPLRSVYGSYLAIGDKW